MDLAAVLDMYARRIACWALESRMTKAFACRALQLAMDRRQLGKDLMHHSNRGSQQASKDYQKLLESHKMTKYEWKRELLG